MGALAATQYVEISVRTVLVQWSPKKHTESECGSLVCTQILITALFTELGHCLRRVRRAVVERTRATAANATPAASRRAAIAGRPAIAHVAREVRRVAHCGARRVGHPICRRRSDCNAVVVDCCARNTCPGDMALQYVSVRVQLAVHTFARIADLGPRASGRLVRVARVERAGSASCNARRSLI